MADPGTIITQPGTIFPLGPLPLMSPVRVGRADPKKEYLAGGWRGAWAGETYSTLAAHAEEVNKLYGPRLWELMDTEPTVSATLTTLAASVVAEGIQFYPAASDPDADGADAEAADAITAYCERVVSDPALDFQHVAFRWVRAALKRGVKLLEPTYELAAEGPDAGRLVPRSLKLKPNWAWSFVVDVYGNQVGVVGAVPRPEPGGTGATSLSEVLPRSKFAVLTHGQEDDDPRGHSILRAAYIPWNELVKLPKERWKFLSRFGTPTWVGTTAPDAQDVPVLDSNGVETGAFVDAQQAMYESLLALANATAVVGPAGSEIRCVEPQGDGAAFRLAADACRRDIVFAILCQVRATMESQYGSKADSETGQDIMGTVVRMLKHWAAGTIRRDLVARWVELNWGPAAARRLTPNVTLGRTDHQDYSRDIRADSEAWKGGLFYESMRPQVLAKYGWRPGRNPGPPSGPPPVTGGAFGGPSSEPAPPEPTGATP